MVLSCLKRLIIVDVNEFSFFSTVNPVLPMCSSEWQAALSPTPSDGPPTCVVSPFEAPLSSCHHFPPPPPRKEERGSVAREKRRREEKFMARRIFSARFIPGREKEGGGK